MRKNLFKKLVAAVAATAMAVTALLAAPQEVSAATEKELYLAVDEDADYYVGTWDGTAGVTLNSDDTIGDNGWLKKMTKVEDGLYKIPVTVDGTVSIAGIEFYKGDANNCIFKSDAQWSDDKTAWEEIQNGLNSADTKVTLTIVSDPWTITVTTASDEEETTTTAAPAGDGDDTTAAAPTTAAADKDASKTGDSTMLFALVAVAMVASVVVLKKRTVTE